MVALLRLFDYFFLEKSIHLFSEGVIEDIFLSLLFFFCHFELNPFTFGSHFATQLLSCLFYSFQRACILNLLFLLAEFMLSTELVKRLWQI